MKNPIKFMLLIFAIPFLLINISSPVLAASCPSGNTAKGQVLQGVGQAGSRCNDRGVPKALKTVVNILSYLVGAIAVIMIIISGFKYVTSAGNPDSVSSAKSTLVYALIGVAIAVLAQFFVSFVLGYFVKFGLLML